MRIDEIKQIMQSETGEIGFMVAVSPLLDRLLATLAAKTGRRWRVKTLLPVVEAKMYVTIDDKLAWVSCPVSIDLLESEFDVAVERIIEGAAEEIGRLIVGLTE